MIREMNTYQQLADHFDVCARTVGRWFKRRKGLFRKGKNTVRVPKPVVEKFIKERTNGKTK